MPDCYLNPTPAPTSVLGFGLSFPPLFQTVPASTKGVTCKTPDSSLYTGTRSSAEAFLLGRSWGNWIGNLIGIDGLRRNWTSGCAGEQCGQN
ncbi:hypothetical protein [Kamptonema formosum]|uniref:hypothetical protein n=1 Tax=Kamptonema formosum TaxID=331992 RepID=UPI00034D50B7